MESFFTDEEVEDIASNHIEAIASLEQEEANRIMKSYKRVRHELRDRLDILSGSGKSNTFTAQKMRSAMVQVDLALNSMNAELNDELNSSSQSAAELGVEHLIKEMEKWNKVFTGAAMPINLNAVVVATKTSNLLFNQRESSLRAYSETVRANIARGLSDSIITQDSVHEMSTDIFSRLGAFFKNEEFRVHRLVRTELHNVYSQGKMRGMLDLWDNGNGTIPDLKKTLYHRMDTRTGKDSKRLAQDNPIVPINEPFEESSTGRKLVYMAPPNRPNDRAILIPFRDEWKS